MSQRWHQWRNIHSTPCPSHGCVSVYLNYPPESGQVPGGGTIDPAENLTENEMLGSALILHGTRPDYDLASDSGAYGNGQFRGLSIHMAFNGDLPVEPGQTGWLTFDLPTWAAIDSAPGGLSGGNGTFVTALDDWVLVNPVLVGDGAILAHTGGLFVLASDPVNSRVLVGMGIVYTEDEEIL